MDNIIRLGDYITEICEKTTVNNQHMVLTSSQEGIVSQDDYFNKQVASKDNTGYKVIRRGQFTYRAMSDTGRFYINRLCDYDTGIVSPAYPVFELKKNEDILPDYLQEYFHSEQFQNSIALSSTGSTRVSLKLAKIADLRIAVPSISDQRHMIIAIQHVSDLISAQNSALCKLDELVKSRFFELFGDPMTNSNNYVLKKYGDLFELNAGGTPSKQKSEYWDNGTISWIGSNMCQNTVIYENDGNYITEEGLKHSSARMFPVDTVLIALVGATIGKTALLKYETTTNQNVLGVRGVRESGYTPEFIFYYTQGLYQKFLNIGDGGFAMASKGFISELPVPVVDLSLQEQFSAFVEQTDKSKLAVKQSLEKLETLKKSLMQQYFG